MDIKPKIDIIVPCYNVERAINRTLKSLIAQNYPKDQYHCYFVNDASTDTTKSILNSYLDHSEITIINHEGNKGRAVTRNVGIKQSSSEFICFLDGDMEVQPDWLQSMLLYFTSPDVVAVMGDNVMPQCTDPTLVEKYYFSYLRGARQLKDGDVVPRRLMLFGNVMMRRNIFQDVGEYDESFLHYGGEDTDLAFRIADKFPKGFRFSNQSASIHYHPRSVESFCKSMHFYGKENLPVLLARYPKYEKELAGDWIHTVKGLLVFNPILRKIINIIFNRFPSIFLIRYKVIDAVITGARDYYKTKNAIE
jgi:glycosyltransferase involved in cell wall biosynthesis